MGDYYNREDNASPNCQRGRTAGKYEKTDSAPGVTEVLQTTLTAASDSGFQGRSTGTDPQPQEPGEFWADKEKNDFRRVAGRRCQ